MEKNIKIKGLKQAVGGYKNWKYAELMFNVSTGEIWFDGFLDEHSYVAYRDKNIVNIGRMMMADEIAINMANVREYINENF